MAPNSLIARCTALYFIPDYLWRLPNLNTYRFKCSLSLCNEQPVIRHSCACRNVSFYRPFVATRKQPFECFVFALCKQIDHFINEIPSLWFQTALHWASKHGNVDVIKLIAGSFKADVNLRTVSVIVAFSYTGYRSSIELIFIYHFNEANKHRGKEEVKMKLRN